MWGNNVIDAKDVESWTNNAKTKSSELFEDIKASLQDKEVQVNIAGGFLSGVVLAVGGTLIAGPAGIAAACLGYITRAFQVEAQERLLKDEREQQLAERIKAMLEKK